MRKAFKLAAWCCLFAVLVILTAFAATRLDHALTLKMEALKSGAMLSLEQIVGRRVTYGQISPSFFRSIDVRDVSIHDANDPTRTLLAIHEVRVSYSLLELLIGSDPVGAIREIRLLNSRFAVDMVRDMDVVDLFKTLLKKGGGPGLRAKITGADIGVTIVSGDSSLDLKHLFFQVESQSQSIAVSLRGDVSGRVPGGFSFASALRAQGTLDRGLEGSDAQIRLLSLTSTLVNTGAQTLQLIWKGNSINVRKIQDRSPVALDLRGDLDKKEFTLDFQSQDLRPDRLFTFSGNLARYSPWLEIPLTASGHVTWRSSTRSLEYEADASAFLADQLPIRGVTLTTTVRGSEKEAYFEPLRLSSADGTAEFEGSVAFDTLFPSGLLSLSNVDTGNGQKINATLAIDRLPAGVDIHGSRLEIGELTFDAFRLSLAPAAGGASFSLSTSFAGSGPEDLLQASGDLRFGRLATARSVAQGEIVGGIVAPAASVSATLNNVPPAKLYHLIVGAGRLSLEQQDIYNLLTHYTISTEAVISTDFSHLSLSARTVTVASTDDPATGFHFGLSVDKSHLSVSGFTGAWKGVTLHGGFDGDLGEGGQIGFASAISLLDNSYFFTGRYSEAAGLTASGSYGLAISALPIRGGGAQVKLHGDRFPIPLEGTAVPVSFDVSGLVTPEGEWSADFSSITFHDVPLPRAPHSVITLRGRLDPRTLDLAQLSVTNGSTTLAGTAHADVVFPGDIFDPKFLTIVSVQGTGSLRTADGSEGYSVKGGLARGNLALALQFDGAPLQRLGISGVQGALSGNGTVNGPLDNPTADLALSLKKGRLGTDILALDGRLRAGPDGFQVSSVSAGYLAHRLTGGEGSLDPRKGVFAFKGQFKTEIFTDTIAVALGLTGSYTTTAGAAPLAARVFDLGLQGKLSLEGIKVAGTEFPSWAISFRTTAGKISFDGGPGNSIHGSIDPQLAFAASLQDPLPITGNIQGRVSQDRIHAAFDVDSFDLPVLNTVLKSPPLNTGGGPVPVFRFTAGVGSGRLVVDGEVNDPDFTGRIDLVGGGIITAYSPEEAGPVRTSLIFEGKVFRIPRTIAAAGPSRLSAEASFTIDHWVPLSWDIAIATELGSTVRLRARYGRLNVQGAASGAVRISGDDRKTNVGGSLVVSDCRITLGRAEEGTFVPEETPTYVNLTIQTGRRVEFHWPSEDVPVIRTTATPGGTIAVTYRGDTGAYTVKGGTGVQGGEIYYFDRTFTMKKGSITFNEDQTTFDPWITARAEVREWDASTGTEVRIYLDADSPFSKFSPRFSSDPPRAGTDILAMIGAPLVNRAETQGIGMAALVYSDILGQNLILRPFEQKVRQVLNLDMFSVRTQILQNLVAQKVLNTTINPLDNTSVSLGKYLGNDLFLEMLVRLQQPQVPVAVITPSGGLLPASMALQPDVELSLEWATPFFLLGWTFAPQHPETMFLSDNSLSFSWSFSY